jgi:hypothetical protein
MNIQQINQELRYHRKHVFCREWGEYHEQAIAALQRLPVWRQTMTKEQAEVERVYNELLLFRYL